MKGLEIKKEFLDTTISFNGSGLPLKFRDDLHVLAKIGLESKDDLILRVFKKVPTLDQIKEYEGEQFLNDNPGESKPEQEQKKTPAATDEKSESKSEKDKPKETQKPGK